jgi:AhpD family alkylhydroperoxidase
MIDNEYGDYCNRIGKLISKLKEELPGPLESFSALHSQTITDGVLDKKYKELIAIGISISTGCEGCIDFHVHDALQSGATSAEIIETIGVALVMGGRPALMRGLEALEAIERA